MRARATTDRCAAVMRAAGAFVLLCAMLGGCIARNHVGIELQPGPPSAAVPALQDMRDRLEVPRRGDGAKAASSEPGQSGSSSNGLDLLATIYLDLVKLDARFAECGRGLSQHDPGARYHEARQCIARPLEFDCASQAQSVAEVRSLIEAATVLRLLRRYQPRAARRCPQGQAPSHKSRGEIVRSPISLMNWLHEEGFLEGRIDHPGASIQLSRASLYQGYLCGLDEPTLAELYLCASLRPALMRPSIKPAVER